MTATTTSSTASHKNYGQSTYYWFTVFTWDAHLFRSICKTMAIAYSVIEDEEFPYYSIFQFTCDAPYLILLIQRYLAAGHPFDLNNFNLKEPTE